MARLKAHQKVSRDFQLRLTKVRRDARYCAERFDAARDSREANTWWHAMKEAQAERAYYVEMLHAMRIYRKIERKKRVGIG